MALAVHDECRNWERSVAGVPHNGNTEAGLHWLLKEVPDVTRGGLEDGKNRGFLLCGE